MNERANKTNNERTKQRTNVPPRTNERTDKTVNERTSERANEQTNRQNNERTNERTQRQRMNEQNDTPPGSGMMRFSIARVIENSIPWKARFQENIANMDGPVPSWNRPIHVRNVLLETNEHNNEQRTKRHTSRVWHDEIFNRTFWR